jgi:hypothetical protein
MQRRKFMVPVFVVVIAVAALFVSTWSMAGVPLQTECALVKHNGGATKFTMKTVPDANNEWPSWDAENQRWEWKYRLYSSDHHYEDGEEGHEGHGNHLINQVDMLTPVCDPSLEWFKGAGAPAIAIYPPGSPPHHGGGHLDWKDFGWWTKNDQVVRVTAKSSTEQTYTIATPDVLPARNTIMGLKLHDDEHHYYCKSIAGPACPDCPGLPFQPSTKNQCMKVEGKNVLMVRNANRCITEIWNCGTNEGCPGGTGGGNCTKISENIKVTVVPLCVGEGCAQEQGGITVRDILGNQICPEGILFSAASPGCSNVRTLSGWIQICK